MGTRQLALSFILAMLLVMCVILGVGTFAANAADQRSRTGTFDMKRQHETMEVLDGQFNQVVEALEKNNFTGALEGIAKMERASDDIAKFRLHRNAKRRGEFLSYSKTFRQNLAQLRKAVEAGDQDASNRWARVVDKSCEACHARFAGGGSHRH